MPLLLTLAFLAGALLPIQAGANATLAGRLNSAVHASVVSFGVGLLTLLLTALIAARRAPTLAPPAGDAPHWAPWWIWAGGAIGAAFVLTVAIVAPRIGLVSLVCWTVAGQLVASLIVDHYGLVGMPVQPITARRLVGAALLVGGMLLALPATKPA